jgi:hypothetical protein
MNDTVRRSYIQFAAYLLVRFPRELMAIQAAKAFFGLSLYFQRIPPHGREYRLWDRVSTNWVITAPDLGRLLLGMDGIIAVLGQMNISEPATLQAARAVPLWEETRRRQLLESRGRELLVSKNESEQAVGVMFLLLHAISNFADEGIAEQSAGLTAQTTIRKPSTTASPNEDIDHYASKLVLEYIRICAQRQEDPIEEILELIQAVGIEG